MNKYEITTKVSTLNNTQIAIKKIEACDPARGTAGGNTEAAV